MFFFVGIKTKNKILIELNRKSSNLKIATLKMVSVAINKVFVVVLGNKHECKK